MSERVTLRCACLVRKRWNQGHLETVREISQSGQNVKERLWQKNHHLKGEKIAFLFPPVTGIQTLLFKIPLFIHPLSIFYSVFSRYLLSHHLPSVFFNSSFSPFSVYLLCGPQWLPHINSQIGSQDPVSQYLTWEFPGRRPSWQSLAPKAVGRSSIPSRA